MAINPFFIRSLSVNGFFTVSGTDGTTFIGNSSVNVTANSSSLLIPSGFGIINSTANVLFFAANGNVGFNTNAPKYNLDVVGTYSTAKANAASQTLTDAATINWDTSLGSIATVTITATGRTMAAPTNLKVGSYILYVIQDATGSRTITTWNSVFKWPGGVAPVLTTTANAKDIFSFVCDGTNLYGSYLQDVK